jgi:hypothetical protein
VDEVGERTLLLRYSAIALGVLAGIEWLLGRTVSRMSASPALEGTPRDIIEGVGQVGIKLLPLAFIAASMLFFLAALDLGGQGMSTRSQQGVALAMFLSLFGTLTVAAPFVPTAVWLSASYNFLSLICLGWIVFFAFANTEIGKPAKFAIIIALSAYLGWFYYIIQQELSARWGFGGAPIFVLNIGEILALATPFAFFVAVALPGGEWRHPRRWTLPILAAILFTAANIADMAVDQGFAGVFTLWSVGFTHFLPWPIYALALAAFLYSILTCFAKYKEKARFANPNTGLGLLLLLFAGYNLQLTYQHLLAAVAFMLFAGIAQPFDSAIKVRRVEAASPGETPGLSQQSLRERESHPGVSG